ncbi:MAG: hypothetical protein ACYCVE_15560 [Gemmatimonadaceae bacterium]
MLDARKASVAAHVMKLAARHAQVRGDIAWTTNEPGFGDHQCSERGESTKLRRCCDGGKHIGRRSRVDQSAFKPGYDDTRGISVRREK